MKKAGAWILKIAGGLVILLLIIVLIVPVLFRNKIKTVVQDQLDKSLTAKVSFDDYHLGLFRSFPYLTFSLEGLSVSGTGSFENDTLAAIGSFNLSFSLSSLFGKEGYEVRSIDINRANFNAIVLKDGSVNWDIMRDTGSVTDNASTASSAPLKIALKEIRIRNSRLAYLDSESDIQVWLRGMNMQMSALVTGDETDLKIKGKSDELTYVMEGVRYLDRTVLGLDMDLLADLDKWLFTFRENQATINDLVLTFAGTVEMPADDIKTDLSFKSGNTSFSSLLSLIPAVYMKDYASLKTSGEFSFSGTARGVYSDADSTLPDVDLKLTINNGLVSYPSLPEKISDIYVDGSIFYDGKKTDNSSVDIRKFHFSVAGSPFDMRLRLATPVSDPDFDFSAKGHLDLAALEKALPPDSIDLSGLIDIAMAMSGRMSQLEKGDYGNFKASGSLGIKDMLVKMQGVPEVNISKADLVFTPAYASLPAAKLTVAGNSDFEFNGKISNYIPYILKDKTIHGELSLNSELVDATRIMSQLAGTTETAEDTAALSLIRIPGNIDFGFSARIGELRYGSFTGKNLRGKIIAKDGVLSVRETGMDLLGGKMNLNADYDTRDSLKPVMKGDFDLSTVSVKETFTSFNTVRSLAPAAKDLDGKVNVKLGFSSLLGKDMMPLPGSISGEGKLNSSELTLLSQGTFSKIREALKLGDKYSNTFRDVNVSFRIASGRVFVSPFDLKTGNLKMNISGDQGIDQTMNFMVKTELPRSDLGGSVNALIDNLSAQAAAFGIAYKPSDIIKVNLKVTGTFLKPEVTPVFGNSQPGTGAAGTTADLKKEATDAAKEKARDAAAEEGARLIAEAEEKAAVLKSESAAAADKIRKEADTRAAKLIDDSKGKSQLEVVAAKQAADALKKNAAKRADQLEKEAEVQSAKLIGEAKARQEELQNKK